MIKNFNKIGEKMSAKEKSFTIKGLQKTTLIDYPDKIACTIFIPKCNFRCGFCYNKDLVLGYDSLPTIAEQEILDFLEGKRKWLDSVVFTGGEPLLHEELPSFIKKIKEKGFLVKVDTNGSNPKMLKEMVDNKLVDYVAMDIKAPLEKYDKIAGVKADKEKIKESVDILRRSDVDSELRLTCVPTLHSKQDIEEIGKWLKGNKKMVIQQFQPKKKMIDTSLLKVNPFSKEELLEFKKILEPYFDEVVLRA